MISSIMDIFESYPIVTTQRFLTFRQFDDYALAMNTAAILDNHQVNYIIETDQFSFDPSFVMNNPESKRYNLKIADNDFINATQILEKEEEGHLEEVGSDYYLYAFTNEELKEVIIKRDEWSAFDYVLAKKLLSLRGIVINAVELSAMEEERLRDLSKPEHSDNAWIMVAYLSAAAGGILGFFIGWFLFSYKKTLPTGQRIYVYDERDRKHGRNIFILSFLGLAMAIYLRFNNQ